MNLSTICLAAATAVCVAGCASEHAHSHSHSHAPIIMAPNAGETLWVFPESRDSLGTGGEMQIYVDHVTHPHARASMAKYTLSVGGALPMHRHDKTEEFAYIISGQGDVVGLNLHGNEQTMPVTSGYVWYNPPGVWHAIRNTGATPLALVFVTVPNDDEGLMSFFRMIAAPPGQAPKPLSPEEFQRIADEHDLILYVPDEQ
ncbi:MAG: cupin domain-containing protein [Phycisphaerales bacterium]|nr:cupin domain-containing protein [Phycisphaerales bacterium]